MNLGEASQLMFGAAFIVPTMKKSWRLNFLSKNRAIAHGEGGKRRRGVIYCKPMFIPLWHTFKIYEFVFIQLNSACHFGRVSVRNFFPEEAFSMEMLLFQTIIYQLPAEGIDSHF